MGRQRRVLVTAAARGIGRAIAEAFLSQGDRVYVCDIDEEALADFARAHPEAGTTRVDIASPDSVDDMFEEALAFLGGLDVLVNNAGIAGPTARVDEIEVEDWTRTIDVNLNSAFYCVRRAVGPLQEAGGGSIIILSSAAGLHGYPLRTPYAASKWALIGLMKSLAMELGAAAIRVNAICPGPVEGPRIRAVFEAKARARGISHKAMERRYRETMSMGQLIDAEDIAAMALFLASPAGAKISGQALAVDGNTETLRT